MSTIEFNNQLLNLSKGLEYFALNLTTNDEEARDLLQDTYLKAIAYRDKFRDKSNLKAWLFTIMKNTFINNYRRTIKARTILEMGDRFYRQESAPGIEYTQESSYAVEEIYREVEKLDDDFRVPFEMHKDGFKYKEIAEHLSLPIGTVKSRIFQARKRLMNNLKEFDISNA